MWELSLMCNSHSFENSAVCPLKDIKLQLKDFVSPIHDQGFEVMLSC